MRTLIVLSCLLFCSLHSFAQSDTVYFDDGVNGTYKEARKEDARYFRIPLIKEGDQYKIEEYYINGQLEMSGYVNNPDSMLYDGFATYYYDNGHKKEYGNYYKGIRIGQWKMKYEDTDRIWKATTYYNNGGDTAEVARVFYRSGKLKKLEYLVKIPNSGKWEYKGVSYAETGEEVPYVHSYIVLPEPTFDVTSYLARVIRYPDDARENHIEGRVDVRFIVLKDGTISDIRTIGKCNKYLGDEAVRVVKAMPKWKPGKQDDEVVKVFYTLPITFLLE